MRASHIYRHKRWQDIDLYVNKVTYVGPKYIKLKVTYINQRRRFFIENDNIKIQIADLPDWKFVE